jgi:hypothetical protein
MGYWVVLPYTSVRHFDNLRLAPAGVISQRDRRPRPIMDYTFYGTNQQTTPHAPYQAMQFSAALQRMLQRIVFCDPSHGPPLLAKVDLADGYYRVPLSPQASLALGVVIPNDQPHNAECLIALLLTLPMGWALSPPYFCAYTETVADMNNNSSQSTPLTLHPLLEPSQATLQPQHSEYQSTAIIPGQRGQPPLAFTDIYIDDFMLITQRPLQLRTMNNLLHNIDKVFITPADSGRREVVSRKKLLQGDATFSTSKRLLGWDVNTAAMTLQLPHHRLAALTNMITTLLTQQRTSKRKWRRLLGTLRSTTPALYGATHLFSILQHALTSAKTTRLPITALLKAVLRDWLLLANDATAHAVPLHTVVPRAPTCLAATDASRHRMGGFSITPEANLLWRTAFPASVQSNLVTQHNPSGTLTNSDLELAAIIVGSAVTATACQHTTSTAAPAYLLHSLAQLRRTHHYDLHTCFTAGKTNTVADCCSRLFALSDTAFLDYMQHKFPIQPSWKLYTPPNDIISAVNCALSRQLRPLVSPTPDIQQPTPHGIYGRTSAPVSTVTPTSPTSRIQYPSCKSLRTGIESAPWLPAAIKSTVERWKARFVPWDRRSPHWAAPTHASPPQENLISAFPVNSLPTKSKTRPQHASSPFLFPSSPKPLPYATAPTHPPPRQSPTY